VTLVVDDGRRVVGRGLARESERQNRHQRHREGQPRGPSEPGPVEPGGPPYDPAST
jgi:hypothetical protein